MSELIIWNDPLELPWQTNLFDVLMLALFVTAVVDALVQFRRGSRFRAYLVTSALIYGVVLELVGMATLNMYLQGDFALMINFPAIPLFTGTTAMPLYVTLFYPVIFSIGFRIVEGLGIQKRWQAAIAGGLFMITLDAPYIIEGNLRHVVWWTWDSDFVMFQYWLGWPLADMFWQATWGATFYYLMLRSRPHLDCSSQTSVRSEIWSNRVAFGIRAPLAAVSVLVIGTIWMLPLVGVTFATGVQWPVLVILVMGMAIVTVMGLRTARPPAAGVDRLTAAMVGSYVVSFVFMVIGNVRHEGGITFYLVVQSLGLVGMVLFATFPVWSAYRRVPESALVSQVSQ